MEHYANNPVEADHARLKARLRPMRGLKQHRSARVLAAGHALVQNLRQRLPAGAAAPGSLQHPAPMPAGDAGDLVLVSDQAVIGAGPRPQ
jgi:hypothetical protein